MNTILGWMVYVALASTITPYYHTLPETIDHYAKQYQVSAERLIAVAKCESGNNPDAVGRAGERGLFQYMPKTWESFNKQAKLFDEPDIWNPEQQIQLTAWAWSKGYQRHWSCHNNLYGIK